MKIICFDVGGTNISKAVAQINPDNKSFEFLEFETIKNPVATEEVTQLFLQYCQKQKKKHNSDKVAVSTARPVDEEKSRIYSAENYYGREFFDFEFLKSEGFQVQVENDGKSFALGEYHFGQGREASSLLTLVIGTGIGGGYVGVNGKVLEGEKGFATEVGHQKMFFENEWQDWESICSGGGIEKRYYKKTGSQFRAQEIFKRAKEDEDASAVVSEGREILGVGIANLLTIFDPAKVVIGGGMSYHREFIKEAFAMSQKNLFFGNYLDYDWDFTELNRKSNLLGVSWKYFE
ncbi:MAG: ROK family protein [Candidatus Moranbacteria bacterium]|nr:ROK family protein [Candidatus Moranbacteria bacterium]